MLYVAAEHDHKGCWLGFAVGKGRHTAAGRHTQIDNRSERIGTRELARKRRCGKLATMLLIGLLSPTLWGTAKLFWNFESSEDT